MKHHREIIASAYGKRTASAMVRGIAERDKMTIQEAEAAIASTLQSDAAVIATSDFTQPDNDDIMQLTER